MALDLFIENAKNNPDLRKHIYKPDELVSALKELKDIIGMKKFKDEFITKLQTYIKTRSKIEKGEIVNNKDRLHLLLTGPPGCGKCLHPEQEVLMFNGDIKKAKDIVTGDKLMGDDSKERNVISTTSGKEEMFEIIPEKGKSFKCNRSHVLTLRNEKLISISKQSKSITYFDKLEKKTVFFDNLIDLNNFKKGIKEEIFDISLDEYLKCDNSICTLIQVAAQFPEKELDKNPYNIGYESAGKGFIDKEYLLTPFNTRIRILAGVVDSGCVIDDEKIIIIREERLLSDIEFLANSLGFLCTNQGNSVYIYGDLRKIPTFITKKNNFPKKNKNCLYQPFKAVSLGMGEYSGFELDGNGRFLLSDFKVTHNTTIAKILCKIWLSMGFIGKDSSFKKEVKSFDELQHRIIIENKREIKKLKEQQEKLHELFRNIYKINPPLKRILSSVIREEENIPRYLRQDITGSLTSVIKIINDNTEFMKNIINKDEDNIIGNYPALIDPKKKENKINKEGLPFYILKRKDFVSRYVGNSAHDTNELLTKCLDGVVYIDEAYNLYNSSGHGDQFGKEALTEINQFMDEHADRIIFIFSGYRDRIYESFKEGQEGLLSRFDQRYDIEGYTSSELTEILILELKKAGYVLRNSIELQQLIDNNYEIFEFYGRDMNNLSMYIRNTINSNDFYDFISGKAEFKNTEINLSHVIKGIEIFKENRIKFSEKDSNKDISDIFNNLVKSI